MRILRRIFGGAPLRGASPRDGTPCETPSDQSPGTPEQHLIFDGAKHLTLLDLASPLFDVVPLKERTQMLAPDSPLYAASVAREEWHKTHGPAHEYRGVLQQAVKSCPNEDVPYLWLGELEMLLSRYGEAATCLIEGLAKARDRSGLSFMLGSVYLRQMKPVAIGWFMQACLLATLEFIAYLFSADVALAASNKRLYLRLLNAADAMQPGARIPDGATIANLAHQLDRAQLSSALGKFEANMDSYLPASDTFPTDPSARDISVWANRYDVLERLHDRSQ